MVIGIATSGKPVHPSDQPHIDLFPLEFQSNPIEFFERYPRLTPNPNPLHLYFGSQYVKGKEVSGWSWKLRPEFMQIHPEHESYIDYSVYVRNDLLENRAGGPWINSRALRWQLPERGECLRGLFIS